MAFITYGNLEKRFSNRDNFTEGLVTGSEITLDDLLSLDLHRYEDEVRTVVDQAVREVSMDEKTSRELEATTWASLELGKEHITLERD